MTENPREPKNVKALIAKHEAQKPMKFFPKATVFSRIKLRKAVPPPKDK